MPPTILPVVWNKNPQNQEWFDLLRLDLSAPYFKDKKGVYMVWYVSSPTSRVIKIGSGVLADQLRKLRENPLITAYSKNGPLKVSWVAVNGVLKEDQMVGVEAFLHDLYNPLIGEKPGAIPIPVKPL
ncbi:hypothetical protein KW807_01000 [Candidatus Parcubacteria bacterium]|nr:hypothetical protein [Candidatus Parcubacteria bacterium]